MEHQIISLISALDLPKKATFLIQSGVAKPHKPMKKVLGVKLHVSTAVLQCPVIQTHMCCAEIDTEGIF